MGLAKVVWEAIDPPLTSSMHPPHHPPKLIGEFKKGICTTLLLPICINHPHLGPKKTSVMMAGQMRLKVSGGDLASESPVQR